MKANTLPALALIVAFTFFLPRERSLAVNTATTSGDWFNPAIWTGNVPMAGDGEDDVRIDSSNTLVSISTGNASVHTKINVGHTGTNGQTGTLRVNGGTFTAAGLGAATDANQFGVGGTRTGVLDVIEPPPTRGR